MRRSLVLVPLAILVLGLTGHGHASSPKVWRTSGVAGWETTERDSIGLASDGTVHVGLARKSVDDLDALTVWGLLRDGNDVLAATGDGGVLYRIEADGSVTAVVTVIQPELTCVGRDSRGGVVFGAAPDGVVYRVEGKEAVQVADLPETYVWDIQVGPDGRLLVATGDDGAVYRIGDRAERWAEVDAQHVTGLLVEGDDVYATTDSPGHLIRIRPNGSHEVLHEGSEGEFRNPVRGTDGNLYFLANPATEDEGVRLYRRSASGAVDKVWTASKGFGYHLDTAGDGSLWVATGSTGGSGAVTRVIPGPPTTWSRTFICPEPQVTVFLIEGDRPEWAATGSLGRVYMIPGATAPAGQVQSTVLDAGAPARWGRAGVEPGATTEGIQLETRSGNTNIPGTSWSEWDGVRFDDAAGAVPSPSARFLQWRLTLSHPERRVAGVRVAYLAANRPPVIQAMAVSSLGAPLDRSTEGLPFGGVAQTLPGGVRIEIQSSNGTKPGRAGDEEVAWARRYRAVTWTTVDPDGDDMLHGVAVRATGDPAWHEIATELAGSPWVWDSSTVPDGWYEVRLLVTDETSNPMELALATGLVSEAFLVDNTAPVVTGLAHAGSEIRGVAEDAVSPLRMLEASLDGGDWRRVFPEDGIPDARRESFRIPLTDPTPGEHVILVRAVDEGGNIGTGRLRFSVGTR